VSSSSVTVIHCTWNFKTVRKLLAVEQLVDFDFFSLAIQFTSYVSFIHLVLTSNSSADYVEMTNL
jgi:hypothetical protein